MHDVVGSIGEVPEQMYLGGSILTSIAGIIFMFWTRVVALSKSVKNKVLSR
jgi:hypothetical protein